MSEATPTRASPSPRFLLLLLGVLAGLLAAEALSRLFYTKPWYERLVEEQVHYDWRGAVRRNALGLRDRDYPATKAPGVKRVLVLGDSFTFGAGVLDASAIFPELLERQLNAGPSRSGGGTVEVLNGGIPGSLTGDWVELLSRVKDSFRPDVILVVFFLRDGTRTHAMGSFFRPIRDEVVVQNRGSRLYRESYLFRLYKDGRDRRYIAAHYTRALNDAYIGDEDQTREWRAAQANLRRIEAMAREFDARVGLVVFPILVELDQDYPFLRIHQALARFGAENGVPTLDLLPAFLGKSAAELWVSSLNQHPNARAHAIAAEAMLPFVRRLLAE